MMSMFSGGGGGGGGGGTSLTVSPSATATSGSHTYGGDVSSSSPTSILSGLNLGSSGILVIGVTVLLALVIIFRR